MCKLNSWSKSCQDDFRNNAVGFFNTLYDRDIKNISYMEECPPAAQSMVLWGENRGHSYSNSHQCHLCHSGSPEVVERAAMPLQPAC